MIAEQSTIATALEPVRDALLQQARTNAAAELARADADVAACIAAARTQAEHITADAHAQGEADAATLLAADRARARRHAHTIVLRAQQAAYAQLRRRSREAARELRADPGYGDLLGRLAELVRRQLGRDAVVREHPDGGVVGDAPGRHVEITLDHLADRAVDELGADLAGLWSP